MESINFNNWISHTPQQSYQYIDYGTTNPNQLGPAGINNDGLVHSPNLEESLDVNSFFPGALDYTFPTAFHTATDLAHLPPPSTSPQAHPLSLIPNLSRDSGIALEEGDPQGRRSSSEEKDNTPAQTTRRKAQNRAAQRAFRERKERHVRDLEAKLNLLTTTTSSLQSDNERLKLMLQRAQTENEILRSSASTSSGSNDHAPSFVDSPCLMPANTRHARSTPTLPTETARLAKGLGLAESQSSPSINQTAGRSSSETHLLSAGATWDLLQSHPLYLSGALDIGEVCERLKKMARVDGMGPMFHESEVRQVIEEVGQSGGDELV